MNACICCHSSMLRHIRDNDIYWFCPSCRQEMPNFEPNFEPTFELVPNGYPFKAQAEERLYLSSV